MSIDVKVVVVDVASVVIATELTVVGWLSNDLLLLLGINDCRHDDGEDKGVK